MFRMTKRGESVRDDEAVAFESRWRTKTQIALSTAAAQAHIGAMTYTDPRAYLYQPGLLDPTQRSALRGML